MADERRAAWGTLTREDIVATAMESLRQRGFDGVTIRGLASEMGVAPMSLYRHVRDKNDILDEVVEQLLAKAWKPRAKRTDWEEWTVEAADRFRRFLLNEPAALHIYLTHPVVSPSAVARMDTMIEVLTAGLGSDEAARRAYAALQTYTIGFAALAAGRAKWQADEEGLDPLVRQLVSFTSPQHFQRGVRYLLAGARLDITD